MTSRDYQRRMAEAARAEEDPVALLKAAADLLRCGVDEVVPRAEALAAEVKRLEDEIKAKAAGWAEIPEGPFK